MQLHAGGERAVRAGGYKGGGPSNRLEISAKRCYPFIILPTRFHRSRRSFFLKKNSYVFFNNMYLVKRCFKCMPF